MKNSKQRIIDTLKNDECTAAKGHFWLSPFYTAVIVATTIQIIKTDLSIGVYHRSSYSYSINKIDFTLIWSKTKEISMYPSDSVIPKCSIFKYAIII